MGSESEHICLVKPTPEKWKHMLNQDDLRFFSASRKIRNSVHLFPDGIIAKLDSWDKQNLKESYNICKLCTKHINSIKYLCYFEYEEDIIRLLTDSEEIYQENAVIMMPAYHELFDINADIIKQIILFLYHLLFSKRVCLNNIGYNAIYVDVTSKPENIQYVLCKKKHYVKTNQIVKIDVGACGVTNIDKREVLGPKHYRKLYDNLHTIMPTAGLKEFVKSFYDHNDDSKLIHPSKVLDCILFTVVAAQCHFPNRCYRSQYSQNMNHCQSGAEVSL